MPGPGERTRGVVTLQDIAARCGCSTCTVSRALHGDTTISAATRERVRQEASALGYNPAAHAAARQLAKMRHGKHVRERLVGLMVPAKFLSIRYTGGLFEPLVDTFTGADYMTMTIRYQESGAQLPRLFARLMAVGVDGLILFPGHFDRAHMLIQALADQAWFDGRPILQLLHPRPATHWVTHDAQQGAYLAATHLLALGHRHLLCSQFPGHDFLGQRSAGVAAAMHEYGLNPEVYLHAGPFPCDWDDPLRLPAGLTTAWPADAAMHRETRHPLVEYLLAHREITGVLALNDAVAIQLWFALREEGLRVPDDISLVGFDDTDPLPDAYGVNQLTTVRLPVAEVGRQAAQVMMACIEQQQRGLSQIALPMEFMLRHTTGPARRQRATPAGADVLCK